MKFDLSNLSFSQEPVVYIAVADALLVLGVSFGLPITAEQKVALDGLLTALATLFARSQVTPVAKLEQPHG